MYGAAIGAPDKGWGGYFVGGQYGVNARSSVAGGSASRTGVYAWAEGGSTYNFGLWGHGGRATGAANENYGLWARGEGGGKSIGVYARGANGTLSYGVYAEAWGSATTGTTEKYAGYFAGDVKVTGTITQASDARLKENVSLLSEQGILGKVMQLRPSVYRFKAAEQERLKLPKGRHFGVLAQEVEAVFPELVSEHTHLVTPDVDAEGKPLGATETVRIKTVNYTELIPILLQAIQEQQAQIEALQAEVQALKSR